jgi:rod shape-determining protein MreC
MLKLIEFIVRFKEYIILCAFMVICFALMSFGSSAQLRGFRTVVVGGIGVIHRAFAWIPSPFALATENNTLREINYSLSREVIRSRKVVLENDRLRGMMNIKDKIPFPMVFAEIVGHRLSEMNSYITINVGSNNDVRESMPVITERGVVGYIFSTSDNYAIVKTIMNRDAKIAVKIERTRLNGLLVWEGGNRLLLTKVVKSEDVQVGDILVTSGYSTLFPADFHIGRITEVLNEENSVFKRIIVEPTVNFGTAEEVFVLQVPVNQERQKIEEALEKRLEKRK